MATAQFTLHAELSEFVPRERRHKRFTAACARAATLKNAVEALGVPHTEVASARVNGLPATLARIVRDGDEVEIFPWSLADASQPLPEAGFVADAHLGGLARFLRMLGYDTVHHNGITDAEIRRLAQEERRLALSRDRELLKCREIALGCYVHAKKPEAQLCELAERFALAARARPFTLWPATCRWPPSPRTISPIACPRAWPRGSQVSCAARAAIASTGRARTTCACRRRSEGSSPTPIRASRRPTSPSAGLRILAIRASRMTHSYTHAASTLLQ